MSNKRNYYAIKIGNNITNKIVNSWEECSKYVNGFPAIYKSFRNEKQAEQYLKEWTEAEIQMRLIWNEIHRRYRLAEKIENELGFKIPMYVTEEIIKKDSNNSKINKLDYLINLAIMNNRLTEDDAKKIREYDLNGIE